MTALNVAEGRALLAKLEDARKGYAYGGPTHANVRAVENAAHAVEDWAVVRLPALLAAADERDRLDSLLGECMDWFHEHATEEPPNDAMRFLIHLRVAYGGPTPQERERNAEALRLPTPHIEPSANHTTHYDDCGCRSARYEAEIALLKAQLAHPLIACPSCGFSWSIAHAGLSVVESCPVCNHEFQRDDIATTFRDDCATTPEGSEDRHGEVPGA